MVRSAWFLAAVGVVLAVLSCAPSQTVVKSTEEETAEKRQEAEKSYSIGAGYYGQGNFDAAMENFLRAVEIDSTYYEPYIAIGNIWRKRRDAAQAEEAFRKAMRIDPERAKSYEGLGDLFLAMGRNEDALDVYRQGLDRDSSLVDLYNGIAEILVKLGQSREADSVYNVALRRFPEDLGVQRLWAEFLYKQKRFGEAASVLGPLVGRFPTVTSLREKLAGSFAELGKYKEAYAHLDTVLAADPSNKQVLLTQGVILSRQRKFSGAIDKFREVLSKDSTEAVAYVYIADARIQQGELGAAESELLKALKVEPDMAGAYAGLGDVYRLRADANRGKTIAATSTPKLEQAEKEYGTAKSYYQKAANDVAYASYGRQMVQYVNENIDRVKKELFIR